MVWEWQMKLHKIKVISRILSQQSIESLLPLFKAEGMPINLGIYHRLRSRGRNHYTALLASMDERVDRKRENLIF